MKCSEIKAHMYDWTDGLLPKIQQREFQAHLDYCPVCKRDVEEMKQVLAALAALKKPAAAPPPDFTARVMNRLREEEKVVYERRFMRIPIRSLAMAASMLFLLGINTIVLGSYKAGGLITLKLTPVTDSTPVEKPTTPPVIVQKPVEKPVNQDKETTKPELPAEDPTETVDHPVDIPGDTVEPTEPDPVVLEPPAETDPPVVEKPSTPKDMLSEEDLVAEVPQPVKNREVNLQNLVLPDPEIFSTQKRVTEGTMVKLDVQHLETASQMLVSNATMQGLTPTVDYTVLTTDGRLIRVYQYDVPFTQVNKFVTGTSTLGRLITEERSQNDITSEYAQKLAQYDNLVEKSLGAKGEEAEQLNKEINELVQELSEMDSNIKNTQKVIVWLES